MTRREQARGPSPWLRPRRALPVLALLLVGLSIGFNMFERSGLPVGQAAPALSVALDDGSRFELASEPGPVVINFWATWCLPCRQEAPILNALQEQGIRVVGIAVDPLPLDKIANHGRNIGMAYPLGRADSGITGRFDVAVIPTTYVIGTDGTILLSKTGLVAIRDLQKVLTGADRGS